MKKIKDNTHQLNLTEDILLNTQLYGIYNPFHYHSFSNTWNYFLPVECDACSKTIYPLMSGGCQCLRCGKFIHRQCLKGYTEKCTFFTFEKVDQNPTSPSTNQQQSTASPSSSTRSRATSETSGKKSKSNSVKQIIKKVSIHQLQNAGSLLLGTVTYIPAIIGSTSVHIASNLIGNGSSSGKSNSNSSTNAESKIDRELNLQFELQLQKIIEKACMIPRMIGYLPEPKSQFCVWTSSLRAIALQQSNSFIAYNTGTSNKYDNIFYLYYHYLKKKQKFQDTENEENIDEYQSSNRNNMYSTNHANASILQLVANQEEDFVTRYSESHFPQTSNPNTPHPIYSRDISRSRVYSVDPFEGHSRESITFPQQSHQMTFAGTDIYSQYEEEHLLYETSLDEMIDVKITAILHHLLDVDHIATSFPSQVCYVCFFIFLSMDFNSILEFNTTSSGQAFQTNLRRNSTHLTHRYLKMLEEANKQHNPHHHLMTTMKHARECIDTIVTSILSKYDQQTIMNDIIKMDNHRHHRRRSSKHENNADEMIPDFTIELMNMITTIVERFLMEKFENAMFDKIFRECSIVSSIFHEKYIASLNQHLPSGENEDIDGDISMMTTQHPFLDPPPLPPVPPETTAAEEGTMNRTTSQSIPSNHSSTGSMLPPPPTTSYLTIFNDYATKLKALRAPMDKLKVFVIFLQFLTTAKDKITIRKVQQPSSNKKKKKKTKKSKKIKKEETEEFVKVPIVQNISNSSLWNTYNESCYFEQGTVASGSNRSNNLNENNSQGIPVRSPEESHAEVGLMIDEHDDDHPAPLAPATTDSAAFHHVTEDQVMMTYQQRLSINDTVVISTDLEKLVINDLLQELIQQAIAQSASNHPPNEEEEPEKTSPTKNKDADEVDSQITSVVSTERSSRNFVTPPIDEQQLLSSLAAEKGGETSDPTTSLPQQQDEQSNENIAAADNLPVIELVVTGVDLGGASTEENSKAADSKDNEEENDDDEDGDEDEDDNEEEEEEKGDEQKPRHSVPSSAQKGPQVTDTDELLEKLTLIIHYQQQNHIIDWIAECIYLSSPILCKDYLAYGIESYALVTLQQSIQLLLTSYYHLEPISARNPSRVSISKLQSPFRVDLNHEQQLQEDGEPDEDEEFYFWRQFL
jgi:hypothetical protein